MNQIHHHLFIPQRSCAQFMSFMRSHDHNFVKYKFFNEIIEISFFCAISGWQKLDERRVCLRIVWCVRHDQLKRHTQPLAVDPLLGLRENWLNWTDDMALTTISFHISSDAQSKSNASYWCYWCIQRQECEKAATRSIKFTHCALRTATASQSICMCVLYRTSNAMP